MGQPIAGSNPALSASIGAWRARRCAMVTALTKFVLFYESAPNVAVNAPPLMAAHRARGAEFAEGGSLLMIGTFGDPQNEGSMSVFTSRAAAEAFAQGDPFVLQGVVARGAW